MPGGAIRFARVATAGLGLAHDCAVNDTRTVGRRFCLTGIALVLAGCQSPGFDAAIERQKLLERDAEWAAVASAGADVEKTISYWSDDAAIIAPGQPVIEGKEAIRAFVTRSFQTPGFGIRWKSDRVTFSPDGKLAYLQGTSAMTVPGPAGRPVTLPGRGITIWRLDADGQWRCVVDIWNDPPPATVPAASGSAGGPRAGPTATPELHAEIAAMDSKLFAAVFDSCDTATLATLVTDDFEMYHDKGGLTATSRGQFVKAIDETCDRQQTGTDYRARRELVPRSMRVYPLSNYGAVQVGEHRFYQLLPGQPERLVEASRFTHVWKKDAAGWKLARVLSYDHRLTD